MTADDPVGPSDLRRLEGRVNARFQELHALLVLHDGRFPSRTDRHTEADRRTEVRATRTDSRLQTNDRRAAAFYAP
jgi:hypothetical protein